MDKTPTAHIEAKKGDFAATVLMPGDPMRAKIIAENFLENAKLVNSVRGMLGYTGTYKGVPVSVMGSGMGNASIGIYSYELFNFYDVQRIIRVGSAGAFTTDLALMDVVAASRVFSDTNFDGFFSKNGAGFIDTNEKILNHAVSTAEKLHLELHVGNIMSSDTFYSSTQSNDAEIHNLLAVEMEGAALYLNAIQAKKEALVLCTISNHIGIAAELSSAERQNSFKQMIALALEMAIS